METVEQAREGGVVPVSRQTCRALKRSCDSCAHRLALSRNPDAVALLLPEWADVIPAIAESIEFRAVVTRCVREIRIAHLARVKRVQELANAVHPLKSIGRSMSASRIAATGGLTDTPSSSSVMPAALARTVL